MTESILKAILRLFAIITQLLKEENFDQAKSVVESYLSQFLDTEKVKRLLYIYHFYNKDFIERSKKRERKKDSLFTVKAIIICEQINKVLLQHQKVLILLQMLDILNIKDEITENDSDLMKALAIAMNFGEYDYAHCKSFVLESVDSVQDKDNVLVIDGSDGSSFTGTHHLKKEYLKGQIIFIHLKNTNSYVFRYIEQNDKLYLNSRKIISDRTYIFEKGSFIHSPVFGTLHYSDIVKLYLSSKVNHNIVLSVNEVEFRFKNSKSGIPNFSLVEESGQMIGIMGGSGVGKSTLLNLLNGNLKPRTGSVSINGYDVYHEKKELKGIIGYIPQDDLLIEELTVFENLCFNAKLCFKDFSKEQVHERVDRVLQDLGLFESKNLKVGNPLNKFISGGQRKRLNISLELIREPYVLFVDEPTSGLSSTDSEMVMDLLKEQSLKGKLVVVNIHQPSSDIFKLFDKLIVLDYGGKIIYQGNPVESLVYFKSHNQLINADSGECLTCGNLNPEQILQVIEAKSVDEKGKYTNKRIVSPDDWYILYKKNIESQIKNVQRVKINLPQSLFNIPGKLRQFLIFFTRTFRAKIADRQYLLINLLEAPLLALILGFFTRYNKGTEANPYTYIFSENVNLPVYIFMGVIVSLFLGMMVSAEEIIHDRKIIQRESFLNLSKFSYYNSKTAFLACLSLFQSFLFTLIGNHVLGIKDMFLVYWLVFFTVSVFSNLFGLHISDNMRTVVAIYILIPLMLVPQILLGGAMVEFDKLNKRISTQRYVPFTGDVIASRWAYEALMVYQFKNNKYEKPLYEAEKKESQASFMINFLIPELDLLLLEYKENPDKKLAYAKNLNIIRSELSKIVKYNRRIPEFARINDLNTERFTYKTENELVRYLGHLKNYYFKVFDKATSEKDSILSVMRDRAGSKEKLIALRRCCYNENLAEIVLNKHETEKIIQYKDNLIQKAEPVFHIPTSRDGRAQFYAPVKRLGNYIIETFWFNIGVIWLINIGLYILLQAGTIRYISAQFRKQ